jgi:hypothetical protein
MREKRHSDVDMMDPNLMWYGPRINQPANTNLNKKKQSPPLKIRLSFSIANIKFEN